MNKLIFTRNPETHKHEPHIDTQRNIMHGPLTSAVY